MPKAGKKLKVVDISDNAVAEEKQEESITDAQELTTIKEEIKEEENIETPVETSVETPAETQVETQVETPLEELQPDNPEGIAFQGNNKKKKSAEYMKGYRKIKQEEQKKLKEDLKHKTEIIEQIAVEPKIIEKIIEKEVILEKPRAKPRPKKVVLETPTTEAPAVDYNNIPEEIILKEIRKRQVSASEQRQNRKKESMNKLKMNIA
jgi:hypothetical protein